MIKLRITLKAKSIEPKSLIYKRFILFLIIISIADSGLSQTIEASKKLNFNWTYITKNEGLSSTEIRCFLKDKKGFLWIGTENGLNRFDGNEFKVFRNTEGDSTTITNNDIYCLKERKSPDKTIRGSIN